MPHVPGLRSCYTKVGRHVFIGRTFDKIRLHAAGKLPAEFQANLGKGFDDRVCRLLGVAYDDLRARVLQGGTDDEILAWCEQRGGRRTDEECEVWNGFMMKRGWRDPAREILARRIKESGLEGKGIETMFEYIEFDEGRDPAVTAAAP
jgi:gluconokinase